MCFYAKAKHFQNGTHVGEERTAGVIDLESSSQKVELKLWE